MKGRIRVAPADDPRRDGLDEVTAMATGETERLLEIIRHHGDAVILGRDAENTLVIASPKHPDDVSHWILPNGRISEHAQLNHPAYYDTYADIPERPTA